MQSSSFNLNTSAFRFSCQDSASSPLVRHMGRWATSAAAIFLALAAVAHAQETPPPGHVSRAQGYGRLPLSFEENQGQTDPQVRFLSRGNGYSLFLTDSAAVLSLRRRENQESTWGHPGARPPNRLGPHAGPALQADVVRMELAGARPDLRVTGADRLAGTANYFLGSDSTKWRSGVSTFGKVRYQGVYSGIDLVYYGNQSQLEYDFVVAPHADPSRIRLHFAGAERLKLDASGDLEVIARNGQIAFHKPVIYQQEGDKREQVDGSFNLLAGNTIGFKLGRYDSARALVIDPTLAYSTYLGGTGGDYGIALAADAAGNAYILGTTYSTDFPVSGGAFQSTNKADNDSYGPLTPQAFVTKLNPAGTGVVYSTYLGGGGKVLSSGAFDGGDDPAGIALDASGNAYVTGATFSNDFPVTSGVFQPLNNGDADNVPNCFVTKLNASGTGLVYSSYLGGTGLTGYDPDNDTSYFGEYGGDACSAIALDAAGNAYITGSASSSDFPLTSSPFQSINKAFSNKYPTAFITKIGPAGTSLLYSTFVGGSKGEAGSSIAVDGNGNAYVGGATYSTDFPISGPAFQTIDNAGVFGFATGFLAEVNPSGSALIYSTFLGGSNSDQVDSIGLDSAANVYASGYTSSGDFPTTPGSLQPTSTGAASGEYNAFVTKLNTAASGLLYSTYLGGSGYTYPSGPNSMKVDASGRVFVTGQTIGTDFPVTANAFQQMSGCSNSYSPAPFISELDPSGSSLLYSTFLGGSGYPYVYSGTVYYQCSDFSEGLAIDPNGSLYVTGSAYSPDFPTTPGAYQTDNSVNTKAFVAKFSFNSSSATNGTLTTLIFDANPQNLGSTVTFTAHVQSTSGAGVPTGSASFSIDGGTGIAAVLDSTGRAAFPTNSLSMGKHQVAVSYTGNSIYTGSSGNVTELIVGPPASITNIAGSGQTSVAGTYFAIPLLVQVKDSASIPVPNATVTFAGTGLTFSPSASVVTNTSGYAYVQVYTAAVGTFTATATVPGVSGGVTFTLTSTVPGFQFLPVTPCRVADTRNASGAFGGPKLAASTTREFDIPQSGCNIPSTAVAYSLNVTVLPDASLSYLTAWPSGQAQPNVSTLNSDGRVKANAAIMPAGSNGGVSVYVSDASHVILDIDGYFVPAGTASALAFYPLAPCRVADTRNAASPLGGPSITAQTSRDFPIQASSCSIPPSAQAYSLNVTALPHHILGYLTSWPTGQTQPNVSTLNSSTGAISANAAIVPAGSGGAVSIYVSDDADVILDINGYFAPPASAPGALSLYTTAPCRVLDTRSAAGPVSGVFQIPVQTSPCALPSSAQEYVVNATVVPSGPLEYISLWADGQPQPNVSTLNAYDGAITSNLAIVPTSNGAIDIFTANPTQVIVDTASYFAP